MRFRWIAAALSIGAFACQEKLTSPGACPDLCPGDRIPVYDTTIVATFAGDSSFFGYVPRAARADLVITNGLPAGELRGFVNFPSVRTDSFALDGIMKQFTVDTVAITFNLLTRDTTVTNLKLYLHRLPVTTDSSISFAALDALLQSAPILDSIMVPDTLKSGTIEADFTGTEIALLDRPASDSGRITFGLTVAAARPTGVQLTADPLNLLGSGPSYEVRGKVDVPDTTRQRQKSSVHADRPAQIGTVFGRDASTNASPDLLYLGGPRGARALVRFAIPARLKDSAQVLRATLELTPATTLDGLPNTRITDSVSVRGIVADLGSKSPPVATTTTPIRSGKIFEGTAQTVTVDMLPLVVSWQSTNGPPPVVLMFHNQEASGAMQPVFFSTRSLTGAPKLRVTYAVPTKSDRP